MIQMPQTKFKIMLVEDNDIDNLITKTMIDASGIAENICIFANGRLGIEYLRATEAENPSLLPDLIFLGVEMPLYDGFYFLDNFAALSDAYKSRRPVVILTGSRSPNDIKKANSYSYVRKYLNKSLSLDEIHRLAAGFYSERHSDTSPSQTPSSK